MRGDRHRQTDYGTTTRREDPSSIPNGQGEEFQNALRALSFADDPNDMKSNRSCRRVERLKVKRPIVPEHANQTPVFPKR